MTDTFETDGDNFETDVETSESSNRLPLIGAAVGAVIGLRRSKTAALVGGVVGATVGAVAARSSMFRDENVGEAEEPVVVTVDDGEEEGETESGTDHEESADEE